MIKVAFQISGGKTGTRANECFFFPAHCRWSPSGSTVFSKPQTVPKPKGEWEPLAASLSPSPQPRVSARLSQARITVVDFHLRAPPLPFQRLAPQPRGHPGCHESRMNQPLEARQRLPGYIHLEHAASLSQKRLQASPHVL